MFFLRFFGRILLFAALAAFAYDCARILATPGEGILLTSLSAHLKAHFPRARENLEHFFLDNGQVYLWNAVVEPMLVLPVSILFGALGALIFMAGYRRPPPEIVTDH